VLTQLVNYFWVIIGAIILILSTSCILRINTLTPGSFKRILFEIIVSFELVGAGILIKSYSGFLQYVQNIELIGSFLFMFAVLLITLAARDILAMTKAFKF